MATMMSFFEADGFSGDLIPAFLELFFLEPCTVEAII